MPIQGDANRTILIDNSTKDIVKASYKWWGADKEKIHNIVFSIADDILLNMSIRRRMNYYFASLYNDTGAQFMASRNVNLYYNRAALDGNAVLNSSMSLNVLQNVIDTATSMIAKNKPKPQFLTDGAKDYQTKVKGKRLTKYVAGVFDEMKIYQVMKRVFLDSCIYGTGAVKLYEEEGRLKAENLFIEEILVDDLEGMHEKPQQIHQRKYIQRDILISQFPKYKELIAAAPEVSGVATFSTADLIPVIESWHLRSSKKSHDGLHTISIENCTLFSEEYKKDYYPILFFRWAHQTLGFWGRGITHEIWKLQRELDIILQTIQRSQRLISGPIIAVESGSNIAESHLTSNKLAKIIEFTATPPQYLTPPSVNPELYQHAQYLEDRMYKVTGVSQSTATSTKDPSLKSAVAIREQADQNVGRFECVAQDFEDCFLDLARMVVDMSNDLDNPSVLINGKGTAQRIDFKDVQADMEDFQIVLFPISGLASTPAGRLDQMSEYAQAGYLSKEQVMDIVDFPDLEETTSLETASLHLTQEILGNIKEKGQEGYMPPGAYMDLNTAFRMACLEVDRATLQGVEEDNIDLLRKFADACSDLLTQSQLPAAQPQQNTGTASQQGSAQVGAQMQQQAQPEQQPPQQGQ